MFEAAQTLHLDGGLIDDALRFLATVATEPEPELDSKTPCLVHGDFATKHILVQAGVVVGLIDFETVRGGQAGYDLAVWDLINGPLPPRSCLMEGYQAVARSDDSMEQQAAVWRIALSVRALTTSTDSFKENSAANLAESLRHDLKRT